MQGMIKPFSINSCADGAIENANDDISIVAAILHALPEWFGIESATQAYIDQAAIDPTWLITPANQVDAAGFITVHSHFEKMSAEIHCLAVRPEQHRQSLGQQLIRFVEDDLRDKGYHYLQVKTLGPSRPDPNYDRTRQFYLALGFTPLEEFKDLWPGNPALQLIKAL